jgi:hypothetical protein
MTRLSTLHPHKAVVTNSQPSYSPLATIVVMLRFLSAMSLIMISCSATSIKDGGTN